MKTTLTMSVTKAICFSTTLSGQSLFGLLFIPLLYLMDAYVFSGIKGLPKKWRFIHKKWFYKTYWTISILVIMGMVFVIYTKALFGFRMPFLACFFFSLTLKICALPFILIDDLRRYIIHNKNKKPNNQNDEIQSIPRSEFLMKAGLFAGSVPLVAIGLTMKSGLYDYQIIRQTLYLPNLPKAFDGMRIAQISDLHAGSLKNKLAVSGGIDLLMREKADIIFFTGDLVNVYFEEVAPLFNILKKIKAPLGVYSCLGNHDYGDYVDWPKEEAKRKNFNGIINGHQQLGWDLIRNSHRRLKVNNEEIGILGVENWGEISRGPQYGRIDLASKNTSELPVRLLLSHDPSYWRPHILPNQTPIDVTFSGHTHGMQLGIRTPDFQFSPVEFMYKEWAGHYQEGKQQLYVNVGLGFLSVAGRVGILPEITIFELKAAQSPLLIKNT